MPFVPIILGGLVLALLASSRKPVQKKQQEQPKLPAATGGPTQLAGNWQGVVLQGFTEFGKIAFYGEQAQAVVTYGIPIALAIGILNWAAGIVALVLVLWVASIVEIITFAYDISHDFHQQGLDGYAQQWSEVHARIEDFLRNAAMVENKTPDAAQLDIAASAYADGFMYQQNYLLIMQSFLRDSFGAAQGIELGWRKGKFAATEIPKPSAEWQNYMITRFGMLPGYGGEDWWLSPFHALQTRASWDDNFRWGGMMISPDSFPAFHLTYEQRLTPIAQTWERLGAVHANATGFLHTLQQKWGIGQTLTSHMAWHRDRGFFLGALKGPPDVPENIGVQWGTAKAYAKTDNTAMEFISA